MQRLEPVIGQWYKRPGRSIFEVVAIDDDALTIELQHFDGTVDELDMDSWEHTYIEMAEAPEDYSGSLDLQSNDYTEKDGESVQQRWDDPLTFLDQVE